MSGKLILDIGDLNKNNPPKKPTKDIKERLRPRAARLEYIWFNNDANSVDNYQ